MPAPNVIPARLVGVMAMCCALGIGLATVGTLLALSATAISALAPRETRVTLADAQP